MAVVNRRTLSFWNEEPHEDDHDDTKASVYKVGTKKTTELAEFRVQTQIIAILPVSFVAQGCQHDGKCPGDDEIEQPLSGRSERNVQRA